MELTVVMPVYNEEEIIEHVIQKWYSKLSTLGIDFEICTYNDGSKDDSLNVLKRIKPNYPNLVVIDKNNSGHGPTILKGYREAKSKWIFQTDSDNEIESGFFDKLWNNKENYDLVVGYRENRESPLARKIITFVSHSIIKILYGKDIRDVNVPFRLYRSASFAEAFYQLPDDTFAPNVILSGYASLKKMKILEIPVACKIRETGEVSIRKWKLLKAAFKSMIQTINFRFMIK